MIHTGQQQPYGLPDAYASMTTDELLRTRAEIVADIPIIDAQLKDKQRRPTEIEGDSPAWRAYREWRRGARWALALKRNQLARIKLALHERNDTSTAARRLRLLEAGVTARGSDADERRENMRADLEAETDLSLLLRACRIIRHLLVAGDELPSTLDERDRHGLAMLSVRLRAAYGKGAMRQFIADDGGSR